MISAMSNEADTCRKFVLPKIYTAGWTDEQIAEQHPITDGRVVVAGSKVRRRPKKKPDYILITDGEKQSRVVELQSLRDWVSSNCHIQSSSSSSGIEPERRKLYRIAIVFHGLDSICIAIRSAI